MVLLITNNPTVAKIIKLSCQSIDTECKIIDNINSFEPSDIFIIDDMYKDISLNNILNFTQKIGYITNTEIEEDNTFTIPRPFLPSTFINIIKDKINDLYKDKDVDSENSICDEGIINMSALSELNSSLDQDEILSLKDTLIKDHSNISTHEDDTVSELDDIIDNAIAQLKEDDE